MHPSKQKSNERRAVSRERRAATGPSTGSNAAYNPISGTFHLIESISMDSESTYHGGKFKSAYDVDDNTSSNGDGTESESISNNGSWSGEAEDQIHSNSKEKKSITPINQPDLEKREKIRAKNERKHQRQKERRAQELKDKCIGCLMSWKLEALSQQLVTMGFTKERAIMALSLNDGHVERSVLWLLEGGGEGQIREDWNIGRNMKIDVSEQLGCILEAEKKFKIPRPDIERAVVSCKGDLEKALELARTSNCCVSPSAEETLRSSKPSKLCVKHDTSVSESLPLDPQTRGHGSLESVYEGRREEKFASFSTGQSSARPKASVETKSCDQSKNKPSTDGVNFQSTLSCSERKEHIQGDQRLFVPMRTCSPQSEPFLRTENGFMARSVKGRALKEEDARISKSHPQKSTTLVSALLSTEFLVPLSSKSGQSATAVRLGPPSTIPYFSATHMDSTAHKDDVAKRTIDLCVSNIQSSYNATNLCQSQSRMSQFNQQNSTFSPSNASKNISTSFWTSSNGLFSSWDAASSPNTSMDWNSHPMINCDYRNIDWSMNSFTNADQNQNLLGRLNAMSMQDQSHQFWKPRQERRFEAETHGTTTVYSSGSPNIFQPDIFGLGRGGARGTISCEGGNKHHEWTSPFEGRNLFHPLQAVPSPSL